MATVDRPTGFDLRREREAAHVSQAALALLIGVSAARVSQIEVIGRPVTPRLAVRYRAALGDEQAGTVDAVYRAADALAGVR